MSRWKIPRADVTNSGDARAEGPNAFANTGIIWKFTQYLVAAKPPPWPEQVAAAAEFLAGQVLDRGREQERRRGIGDPYPLPLRWHTAPSDLVDQVANIRGTQPGEEPRSLVLDGRFGEIATVYRTVPSGRLVLLGDAGSGKSIVAQRLALDLIATPLTGSDPVPVLFSVRSWNPVEDRLVDWISGQILRDYHGLTALGQEGQTLAAGLLEARRVMPVLDGFDEMAPSLYRDVLRELNATDMPLVLTSRPGQYAAAVAEAGVLRRAAAVVLDDLTLDDLAPYLPRTAQLATADRWDLFLTRLREGPEGPGELPDGSGELTSTAAGTALATPLMVGLARAVYSNARPDGPSPLELLDAERFPSAEAVKSHLLEEFLPAVYERRPNRHRSPGESPAAPQWDIRDVRRWLGHLARRAPGQDLDLAWWLMGDDVPRSRRIPVFAVLAGLLGALAGFLVFGPPGALAGALAVGALGAVVGWSSGPVPARMELRTAGRARHALPQLVTGLTGGVVVGLVGWPAVSAWGWPALALAGGVGSALGSGLSGWARHSDPEAEAKPVLLETLLGLGGGLAGGFAVGLIGLLADAPVGGYAGWLALGATIGLGFALGAALLAPTRKETVVTPTELLLSNRTYTVFQSITIGTSYGLVLTALVGPLCGIVFGPVIGLAFGVGAHAWGRWLVLGRLWLPLTGRLPWRAWVLLADAHERGVLRQAGAVYQFRHDLLQRKIAADEARDEAGHRAGHGTGGRN
ncbi:NACHT domain-containing protein [Streptomyces sp. NBC_01498]|uniref:NACHT domain-containing protein n=1 Tax=Streptomyces sp. NBC_01498 TaxID=2975870 RepID=UPI002E7AE623|nr:NACHT domain-containing protein [Streptomyces sp. NBC_01498]WTL25669.1 NACHT domain-containing protein [Streptomyces sp. NBC_01498]